MEIVAGLFSGLMSISRATRTVELGRMRLSPLKGRSMRFLDLVDDIAQTSGRLSRRGPFLSPEEIWSMTRKTLFRPDLEQFLSGLDDRAAIRGPVDDTAAMLVRMATLIHGRWLRAFVITDLAPSQIGPVAPKVGDIPHEHYEHLSSACSLSSSDTLSGLPNDQPGLVACYLSGNADYATATAILFSEPRFSTTAKLLLFNGDLPDGWSDQEENETKLLFRGRAARFGSEVLSCLYVSNTTTAAAYND